jgi:hypothetical protein
VDVLGEVPGVGGYAEVEADASMLDVVGLRVKVMGIATLESSKRAGGRAKDLLDLAELTEIKRRIR